jgi:hypothetical protein
MILDGPRNISKVSILGGHGLAVNHKSENFNNPHYRVNRRYLPMTFNANGLEQKNHTE